MHKHMTGNLSLLCNFVEKYLGTVRFGNDQFAPILGYGDLVQGNITIKRVYYVEGLNHNLFSVGQFYDADLEVAFGKSTCFVRDLQRNELTNRNGYAIRRLLSQLRYINVLCVKKDVVMVSKTEIFENQRDVGEFICCYDTSGSFPKTKKASDYDNPDPAPELQNVSPLADTTVPSQQELDFFSSLFDDFSN
ncbi:hypothetical protein Tco_1153102 [Tanacetum coccineum]